jgi:hypothetical protein
MDGMVAGRCVKKGEEYTILMARWLAAALKKARLAL